MAVSTEIHCETRLNRLPEKSFGQINQPFLPRPATANRLPFSNPFRWHHSVGQTVWRFEVEGIVVFFRGKDLLPNKCDLSRVLQDFGGMILRNPLHKAVGFFCQTLPLTMKNKSQNMASGGLAAKVNSRQR
jgi:hypothetical protein